jgi:hypothetical protein
MKLANYRGGRGELQMNRWIMGADLLNDITVTAIALGAVMTFAVIGFVLVFSIPPI